MGLLTWLTSPKSGLRGNFTIYSAVFRGIHSTGFNSFVFMRGIIVCIISIMFFAAGECSAQQKKFRSSSYKTVDSTAVVNAWLEEAGALVSKDHVAAFGLIEKALVTSLNQSNQYSEAKCYFLLGKIYLLEEQPDLAQGYLEESSRLFNKQGHIKDFHESEKWLAKALNDTGEVFKAQKKLETGRGWAISNKDAVQEIEYNGALADNYQQQGMLDESSSLFRRNVKVADSLANPQMVYSSNLSMAGDLISRNELDSARIALNEGLVAGNSGVDPGVAYEALNRVSNAYLTQGLADSALALRQSFESNNGSEIGLDGEYRALNTVEMGNIYLEDERVDEAIDQFETVLTFTDASMECKQEALYNLSSAYVEVGETDRAIEAFSGYASTLNTLQEEKQKRLKENVSIHTSLNTKIQRIQLLEKDREISEERIARLEQEALYTSQRFNNMLLVVIALFGGLLLAIMVLYNRNKANQKEKIANQLIALKSLRSQMNPHFIFNALNSVNNFIAKNDERMANRYLADFSTLMRRVLSYSDKDFIELSEELELLQLYLKLEHERFPDKFDYHFDIDPALQTQDIRIPPMLIQPFVENAVWHGLRYLEEKGTLNVVLKREGDNLSVQIKDSGIGRKQSKTLKTDSQKSRQSVGISNIENRLKLLGEIYGSRLQVSISDINEDGSGTLVEMSIPTNIEVHG